MTISHPNKNIFSTVAFEQQDWRLQRRDEISQQAGGQIRGKIRGVPLWAVRLKSFDLMIDEALELESKLDTLDGVANPFYFGDLRRPYPKAIPGGVFSDSGVIDTRSSDTSLTLKSLPAGFVISVGDYFQINQSGVRTLHRAAEAVTADGAGLTAEFEVRPFLPSFAVADKAVTFKEPTCRMIMVPGSFSQTSIGTRTEISFEARQTY